MDYVNVKENDRGFGPLRWFGNSRDAVSPGSALLGRGIAIYDFRMDYNTDLEKLADDLHFRMTAFRSLNIWMESESNKVRKAWTNTCYDHPGKGMDDVMGADVTLDEVTRWYDFEYNGLADCVLFDKLLKSLWGGDFVRLSEDLNIHGRIVHLWRNWDRMPSPEVRMVLEHAFARALHLDDMGGEVLCRSRESYDEDEAMPYRETFIRAWREAEDILLSCPAPKRHLINLEEVQE